MPKSNAFILILGTQLIINLGCNGGFEGEEFVPVQTPDNTQQENTLPCADPDFTIDFINDGDTFITTHKDLGKFTIRVRAIDTPETEKPDAEAEYCAEEAFQRSRALLGQGFSLAFDSNSCPGNEGPYGCTDIFGRTLAYVTLGNCEDLGNTLIQEGFATILSVAYPFDNANLYETSLNQAEQANKGIFSTNQCVQP